MNSEAKIAFCSVAPRGWLGPGYKCLTSADVGGSPGPPGSRTPPSRAELRQRGRAGGDERGGLESTGSHKQGWSQRRGSAGDFGAATRAPGENNSGKKKKKKESCTIALTTFLRALEEGGGRNREGDSPHIRGLIIFCTIPA